MPSGQGPAHVAEAAGAARGALRWVTDAAVTVAAATGPDGATADGVTVDGATWPVTRAAGAPCADDLYDGTAGILVALADARLSGIGDFDEHAGAAASELASAGRSWPGGVPGSAAPPLPGLGLYTGLAGAAAALRAWALASGDDPARRASQAIAARIARACLDAPQPAGCPDLISGDAGILLALLGIGGASAMPAASAVADRIVAAASWSGDRPDWYPCGDGPFILPNFSHGAAGVGYALALAGSALGRPDLLAIAELAARGLAGRGRRPDGTIAVPHSIPLADPAAPVSYGWCHGPTGTMRLFQVLDRLRPGRGWGASADACGLAVRRSGLPERRYPGFWDNLGQCCGTAGVGEMALDAYQETGDAGWLGWAWLLARDVLDRRIEDDAGVRWSHTEHRADPPGLEPATGLMQGAAGIAGWLLRLCRAERDGPGAARAWRADRPALPGVEMSLLVTVGLRIWG